MKATTIFVVCLFFFIGSASGAFRRPPIIHHPTIGDLTTGVLPSYDDAYANWQIAGLLGVGGIPSRSTQCGSTLTPSGGDDTSQINAAITACTAGQVVQLGAGTFDIAMASMIKLNKGVTLRGTGTCSATYSVTSGAPNALCSTIIVQNNGLTHNNGSETCSGGGCTGTPVILMSPAAETDMWSWSWSDCSRSTWVGSVSACGGTVAVLTADAVQGATTINVNTTSPFSVGMWVLIDEASGAAPQTDPVSSGDQIFGATDAFNSSGSPASGRLIWAKHLPTCCNDDFGTTEYPYQSGAFGGSWAFVDRPTAEIHLIKSIGSGTLTFDSPLTVAFRQSGSITFNGAISGTTLTTTGDSCLLAKGEAITGAGVTDSTYITAKASCSGGVGSYTVSASQSISSEAMTGAAHIAHVYYPTTNSSATAVPFLTYAGVENLTVQTR